MGPDKRGSEIAKVPDDGEDNFPLVGIGASAGGLEAFTTLLHALPPDPGMAFVYIQHLDPLQRSILPELLAPETRMPVQVAEEGLHIMADRVYVIPPNTSLTISRGILHLSPRGSQPRRFTPIDEFFQSLAIDRESLAIGVILSGSAFDGTLGIQAIHNSRGITFAQTPESAARATMPQNAIETGVVDFVLDPAGIAEHLVRIGQNLNLIQSWRQEAEDRLSHEKRVPEKIYDILRTVDGVDFSQYKQSTMTRRIGRRMVLHKLGSLDQYAAFLQDHPEEIRILAGEMLIHVTSFFREPETFALLKTDFFPLFFKNRIPGTPIRIWVPGCSTGEEVYSILMCLLESMEQANVTYPVQLFATDVSDPALAKAREGLYHGSEVSNLSRERRKRFFDEVKGDYRIKKEIRDSCIFSVHDLTKKDPPFSHLDLISCRNLLIYLGVPMQRHVIPLFHASLNPDGILLLGISETVGPFVDLFSAIDKKHGIYRRKPVPPQVPLSVPAVRKSTAETVPRLSIPESSSPSFNPVGEPNSNLGGYGPPSVLVNEAMDILQFSGKIGQYLEPAHGEARLSLNRMIQHNLLIDLRTAIHKARKMGKPVRNDGVIIRIHGREERKIGFIVTPIYTSCPSDEWHYLIVIDDGLSPHREPATESLGIERDRKIGIASGSEPCSTGDYQKMQEELVDTRGHFQSMSDEGHRVNEELKSKLSERESAKEAARISEEEYRGLLEHNPDMIIRYDRLFRYVYANPAVANVTNIPADSLLGKTPREVNFPQDATKDWEERIHDVFLSGKAATIDIETGSGEDRRVFTWNLLPESGPDGRISTVLSTSRDITHRWIAENKLRQKISELEERDQLLSASLAEKEALLSGIHLRVKNNISTFIALLSLESSSDKTNPEANPPKLDLQNRARSIALVHDTLYRTKMFASVDMGVYLKSLIGQVIASHQVSDISLEINTGGISLDLDRAMPCGLIVSEFTANAIKYAFPPSFDCRATRNAPCTIRVSLTKRDGMILLTFSDNGRNLPPGFDPRKPMSLSLKMVNFLAHHLRANIEYRSGEGTTINLRFPENRKVSAEPDRQAEKKSKVTSGKGISVTEEPVGCPAPIQ